MAESGGTADPILQGTYAPPLGTEFDVITGPWGTGTYTTINNDFTGDYAHTTFVGLVRDRDSTTTSVASSLNPSNPGQSVTFTATVTAGAHGLGNPTGTVTFLDNGTEIGSGTVSTTGPTTTATLTTSSLSPGTHPITATYGGDSDHKPSAGSSPAVSQVVKTTTSTTLTSSANPSVVGQSVTFTAKIAPSTTGSASPTGSVIFLDHGTELGTGAVSTIAGTATAAFTTSSLSAGTHAITATYGGDGNYIGSTSPTVTQAAKPASTRGGPGKPTASRASLTGAGRGKPKLSFTLTEGAGAAALKTIVVALPRGLAFSAAKKRLAKGVTVKSPSGTKLKFTATVKHGKLTISLKTGEPSVRITVASLAITITKALARKVKHKTVKALTVTVTVTATDRTSTAISLKLRPS